MHRVVIVGGSVAGVHAAEALRDDGFQDEIILLSAESHMPYDRPPLSKEALLGKMSIGDLSLRPESFYDERDIKLNLNTAATALNTATKTLFLSDGNELTYDGLVLATGSTARNLSLPFDSVKPHIVRSLDDVTRLAPELIAGRRITIVGAGFIGLEVASTAIQLGLEVTIIESAPAPLSRIFGAEVGSWFKKLHEKNGVNLLCDVSITGYEQKGKGLRITLSDDRVVEADLLVAGIGAVPSISWLEGSGIELGNGVICAPDLSTSAPDVVSAGDISLWRNPVFEEEMRIEHWSNAADQGRHAALTLLGDRKAYSSVPYFWTDQYDSKLRFVGRAAGYTDTRLEQMSENELVVTFGRNGTLVGAICVGAPKLLASYKNAINSRMPWLEAANLNTVLNT